MERGTQGETVATRYLENLGYRVVARNYRCPLGEIDIIALDGDTVVFVEVKSRTHADAADPEAAIHFHKRRRVTLAAKAYVAHKSIQDRPCRFDVVAVVLPEVGEPEIEHFIDAFAPTPK